MPERPVSDEVVGTIDALLKQGRPALDPIAMERARACAEQALFGHAEPARLGRYQIVDRIGTGGMGVVYSAYDPELDRRVALKLVHPQRGRGGRWRARLITEARALAKLDHPNVVRVHDVIAEDEQLVIVMELIEGQTLAQWASGTKHAWREAVDIYCQAADGLVAAHGVGVVHRDFKPSNTIMGKEGRIRVLDFGLARLADAEEPDRFPGTPADPGVGITQTGDIF